MSAPTLVSLLVILVLALSGVMLLWAFRRGQFRDTERAKYEMMGTAPPPAGARGSGRANQGVEDRILRVCVAIVLFYYAFARLGIGSVGGVILTVAGAYLVLTGLAGYDPLYKLLKLDTRLPEHRRRR